MKILDRLKRLGWIALAILPALLVWPNSAAADNSISLVGGGASFPAPLYQKWYRTFYKQHPDVLIDYQPLGSGAGISQFMDGRLDFAGTDVPLSQDQVSMVQGGVVQIPMTAGALVLVYNLDGVEDLKLSRKAYTGIFEGEIDRWNHPAIAESNPGANLPDSPIVLVTRSDASGTTYTLTRHLSAVSEKFDKTVGVSTSPVWPEKIKERGNLIRARGNGGVVNMVKALPASIGYVEYSHAYLTELPIAKMENVKGEFVAAGQKTFQGTLREATIPDDLTVVLTDPAFHGNYPVVAFTWLLVRQQSERAEQQKALKELIRYCLTDGQKVNAELGYIPLSDEIARKALQLLEKVH